MTYIANLSRQWTILIKSETCSPASIKCHKQNVPSFGVYPGASQARTNPLPTLNSQDNLENRFSQIILC